MKNRKLSEGIAKTYMVVCGFVSIIAVAFISVYMIGKGIPGIKEIGFFNFIFGTEWKSTATPPSFGILPFILSSLIATLCSVVVGVSIGLMIAVYIAKLAHPKVAEVIRTMIEVLSGIPSVVLGMLGMLVLVPAIMNAFDLPNGTSLFAVIIVLSIMVLPNIISVSDTALTSVPKEYEDASIALGATKIETIFKVSIPAAKNGIATGIVLGIGRAIGETMAVMMVAGNVANMPKLFSSVTLLTTAISKEMSYSSGLQRDALFSIALVLFIFIMLINLALNVLLKGGKKK